MALSDIVTYCYGWTGCHVPDSPQYGRDSNGWWCKETIILTGTNDPGEIYDSSGEHLSPVPDYMETHSEFPGLRSVDVDIVPHGVNNQCRITRSWRQFLEMNSHLETWSCRTATQSIRQTSVIDADHCAHIPSADNYGTAINVKGDQVEGVDALSPKSSLSVSKLWTGITDYGRRYLDSFVATVNAYGWQGYYAGEVLFVGYEVEPHPYGVRIEYNFLVSPFHTDYPGGPPQEWRWYLLKDGYAYVNIWPWEYLWMVPGVGIVTGHDGRQIPSYLPQSIHLAQLYEYRDFSQIGLHGGA